MLEEKGGVCPLRGAHPFTLRRLKMNAYLGLFAIVITGLTGVFAVSADIPERRGADWQARVLHAQHVSIHARADIRKHIVEDFIAGRLTLAEAASQFGELNAKDPETLTALQVTLTGDSDQERLCRQVLMHVKCALEDRPSEAGQV